MKIDITADDEKIRREFEQACTFILCSNDLTLTAEDLLTERIFKIYKIKIILKRSFDLEFIPLCTAYNDSCISAGKY